MPKSTEQQLDAITKELKRLNRTLEEVSRVYRMVSLACCTRTNHEEKEGGKTDG